MKYIEAAISIKYSWDQTTGPGVDAVSLGESLIGFDQVIKEQIKLLRLHSETQVEVKSGREGSIIIDLIIRLHSVAFFSDWQSYVDLMKLAGQQIPGAVVTSWEALKETHQSVNDFVAKYPVDAFVLQGALIALWKWGAHQKNAPTTQLGGKQLPSRYAGPLRKMIREHTYRKALAPIINDSVRDISVSATNADQYAIGLRNFEDYLSEDQCILPEYENGQSYIFKGEIVGLESSKGDYLKFRAFDLPKQYRLLTVFPPDGENTLDYKDFYKQKVMLTAKVMRKSDYQKPKLKVETLEVMQKDLF